MTGYPTKEQILASPDVKFRPGVLAFVRAWKRKWVGRRRSPDALSELIAGLAQIYDKPVEVQFQPGGGLFGPSYSTATNIITLDPERPSLVTALHEFAHHVFGHSELKACRWSVHLFRRTFPKTFQRARFEGHLLRIDPQEPPVITGEVVRAIRVRDDEKTGGAQPDDDGWTESQPDDDNGWTDDDSADEDHDDEDDDRGTDPVEFTETDAGEEARERWASAYDDLNGAPENDGDR